jgi:hypothetical protein
MCLVLSSIRRFLILQQTFQIPAEPVIRLRLEQTENEGNGFSLGRNDVLVGTPTASAVEYMLSYCGFRVSYYNWHNGNQTSWKDLEDYQIGLRVSLVATRD